MPESASHEQGAKPPATVAMVAARAGVSTATVSLALRNHPRITARTRERVRRAADELGYRPDPQLAKLMAHLRKARPVKFRSVIAGLTTIPAGLARPYVEEVMDGARQRARQLGYEFNVFRIRADEPGRRLLGRELRYRGIEGVVLLPMMEPVGLADLLDWRSFSIVAATYSVLAPEFHRVVPYQFGNVLQACAELAKLGYRRIGLVLSSHQDVVVHHGFTAAAAWQGMFGGTEMVRPFVFDGWEVPAEVKEWFALERPDVIIAGGEDDCRKIAGFLEVAIPGSIGFAVTNCHDSPNFAGIDERPEEIGAAAIDLLHAKIQIGEKGVPPTPTVTMINGEWKPRATVRRQPGTRGQRAKPAQPGVSTK
jgi:DNA-binding LacI/PurR family transcriptional regulator